MLAGILLLTALIYLPTLSYGFVFDDHVLIETNENLLRPDRLGALLSRDHWAHDNPAKRGNYYRPVMHLNYWLTCRVAGASPFAFHLVSLIQHLICVALVFELLRRLRFRVETTAAATLLFALHPSRLEVVAWVAGANSSFAAAQTLAVVVLTLAAREARSAGHRAACIAGAVLLTVTALFSKESAATLPGQIGLAVFVFESRRGGESGSTDRPSPGFGSRLRSALAAALPFVVVIALGLIARRLILGYIALEMSQIQTSTLLGNVPRAALGHLWLLLLTGPRGPFYDFTVVSHPSLSTVLIPTALILGLVALTLRRPATRRAVAFGWCWLGGTILPVLNLRALPRGEILHDRFLYLPGLGFCVVAGALIGLALRRLRPANALAALLGLGLVLGSLNLRDSPAWHDDARLWAHAVRVAPRNVVAHQNHAARLVAQGRFDEAEGVFRRILRLAPRGRGHASAFAGLATVALLRRDWPEAEARFRQSLALEPRPRPSRLTHFARVLIERDKLDEALAVLGHVLKIAPQTRDAHALAARVFVKRGETDRARRLLELELLRRPGHREARELLKKLDSRRP